MRWVTATHLEQWADTRSSQAELSEVISDLIRATAPTISSFRFPTGDSAQIPGYDGRLISTGVVPYIPDQESVWEFGTSQDYVSKANEDYKTRTENPRTVIPNQTAFVFVTPRRWRRNDMPIDKWIGEKAAENVWREIRVIDGIALEEWLADQSAAGLRLARRIGVAPPEGAQSTDQFWEEYSSRFDPILTEKMLLAGREQQAKEMVRQLRDEAFRHVWQADSPEEVIAFAIAAIRNSEHEDRKYLEARTVVVSTEEAARNLASRPNLIFLPRGGASKLDAFLAQKHATVIAIGRDTLSRQDANVLYRPTSDEFIEALKTMGLSDERSVQLGHTCGRSVTILARRIPSGTMQRPEWEGQHDLIPALLAGGWHAQREEDKAVVAQLASVGDYFQFEDRLRAYIRMQDPPLEKEGDVWKVRAPVDAFVHLAPLLGRSDLERLSTAAQTVFSQRNPVLDMPVDERFYAGIRGQRQSYSDWLRTGIATTLLLISELHEQVGISVSGIDPTRFVDEIVAGLPDLETDYRAIAGLHGELTLLMEASPHPLLSALEYLLEGDGSRARSFFQDQEDTMFGPSSPHTAVLWALELIAWDPTYIARSCLILAKLGRIDPGGRLANRPIKSLREILLPWHPNTNASVEQRLGILDAIVAAEPEVGWDLLLKLLPENYGVGSNTPKPRYREAGASQKEVITRGLVVRTYRETISRTIEAAGNHPDRWVTLVSHLASFAPTERTKAVEVLESIATQLSVEGKNAIWTELKTEVNRHRAFQSADWSMKGADLDRLQVLLDKLQPGDTVEQIAWLFDEHMPHVPSESNLPSYEAIEPERQKAIARLISADVDTAITRLLRRAKLPQTVTAPAVVVLGTPERVAAIVDEEFGAGADMQSISLMSAHARFQFGDSWSSIISAGLLSHRWSRDQVNILVLSWRDERATWDFLHSLGPEIEDQYWKQSPIHWVQGGTEDLEFAARKLLDAGRPLAAIRAMHHSAGEISTEILFELLDAAINELSSSPDHASTNLSYEIDDLFQVLRNRVEVAPVDIARREYTYLPLFGYREKNLTIHTLLAQDPPLFVSILVDVFKPESGEPREATEQQVARAKIGYRLLSEFKIVPGTVNGELDTSKLSEWITEVRKIATENDRPTMADEYVGKVLAHTPTDPDGVWPDKKVAELIEKLGSKKIEQGISIERLNMRGATWRGPFDGGDQERTIANQVRGWANARKFFPRTFSLLNTMADSWEREGALMDEQAKQDAMKFE
jgi:hypothetical protein